jgi:hypothetical protein
MAHNTQVLHSLAELAGISVEEFITKVPEAWESSIDRHELAFIRRVGKVERMLRRNNIRFQFDEEERFVLSRYRKGSEYPLLGYIRINEKDYSFGTEDTDYAWNECFSEVLRKIKAWLGGASFELLQS